MIARSSYVCLDCGRTVSSLSYRAACPDCGGGLEPTTAAER